MQPDIVRGPVTLHSDDKGPIGSAELHSDIPIQGLSVFSSQPGLVRRFFIRQGDQISAHVRSRRGWLRRWHSRHLITINGQDCEVVRHQRLAGARQAPGQVRYHRPSIHAGHTLIRYGGVDNCACPERGGALQWWRQSAAMRTACWAPSTGSHLSRHACGKS